MDKKKVLMLGLMSLMLLCLATIAYASIAQAAQKCENPPCSENAKGQGPQKSPKPEKEDSSAVKPAVSPAPKKNEKSQGKGQSVETGGQPVISGGSTGSGQSSSSSGPQVQHTPPDQDGHGPERDFSTQETLDPNQGCGQEGRLAKLMASLGIIKEDGNEGWCGRKPTNTPPPSETPSPSPSPTDTPTPTFTPSPTATPTSTATPVVTEEHKGGGGGGGGGEENPPGVCPEVIIQDQKPTGILAWFRDLFAYPVQREGEEVVAGTGRNITSSYGRGKSDVSPSHSPDTCEVTWRQGGELQRAYQDGSNAHSLEVTGREPSWGEYGIGFVFGKSSLYSYDLASQAVNSLGAECDNPDVSPSGDWVACTAEDNTLRLVSYQGAYFGQESTRWICLNPSWASDGSGMFCYQPGKGTVYIDAKGKTTLIYKNGFNVEQDPLRGPAAIVSELGHGETKSWLVQDVFAIGDLESLEKVGQLLGNKGENPTWWALGFGVESDSFMEQFMKGG